MGRWILVALVTVVLLAAAAMVALATLDDSVIRRAAIRSIAAATGRDVEIRELRIRPLSFNPRVIVSDVRIGNAPWAAAPNLLELEEAELVLSLPGLIVGRVRLPYVRLQAPRAFLERNEKGEGNWNFVRRESGSRTTLPGIESLIVNHGRIEYREGTANSFVQLEVKHSGPDANLPLAAVAEGRWRGAPLAATARAGSMQALFGGRDAYPLKVQAQSGRAKLGFDGEVRPFDPGMPVDARVTATGNDLWDLRDLAGIALPHTRPYSFSSRLLRTQDEWQLREIDAKVGESDISGNASLTYRDHRPMVLARLRSERLDLADLAGTVGADPAQGMSGSTQRGDGPGGKPAPANAARRSTPAKSATPVLPEKRFDLARLQKTDADISLSAASLKRPGNAPLDRLEARVVLDHGKMTIAPVRFGVAQGVIDASASVRISDAGLRAESDLRFRNLQLAELLPRTKGKAGGIGALNGHARLASQGAAVDELLGNANGRIGLMMRDGEMSNLLLEIVGLDAGEAIGFLIGRDKEVPIRCGVAGFVAKDGVFSSDVLVFDTRDTNVTGRARVDMRSEQMQIDLFPEPKDVSIAVLRAPLHIHGPFAKPRVDVDKGQIAARAGAAIALGMINPLAALIPLIEPGPGKDAPCEELIARVMSPRSPTSGQAGRGVRKREAPEPN